MGKGQMRRNKDVAASLLSLLEGYFKRRRVEKLSCEPALLGLRFHVNIPVAAEAAMQGGFRRMSSEQRPGQHRQGGQEALRNRRITRRLCRPPGHDVRTGVEQVQSTQTTSQKHGLMQLCIPWVLY